MKHWRLILMRNLILVVINKEERNRSLEKGEFNSWLNSQPNKNRRSEIVDWSSENWYNTNFTQPWLLATYVSEIRIMYVEWYWEWTDNGIECEGARLISNALKRNTTLTKLDIGCIKWIKWHGIESNEEILMFIMNREHDHWWRNKYGSWCFVG